MIRTRATTSSMVVPRRFRGNRLVPMNGSFALCYLRKRASMCRTDARPGSDFLV